jgi:tripartite-type tricarboxylate transporter receptor subunit TctC
VRIVVGFPAGGATDIQARLMGQWLSDRLGQQFIIENRAGASGNIGTEAVAKAPADGYTLLQVVTPHAINAALYTNLNFDFIRDIAPVICAARLAYVVVVHPSVPATTIPEFIAYAKANPGKINYGSAGHGTPQNICCELFKMMTGVNLVHIPYRGGAPATSDLVAGHLQVIFSPVSESIEHIKVGNLRALAVTTAIRLDVLPDVPTVGDVVPGYEASGFAGIGAPRNPSRNHRYAKQGAQCRPRRYQNQNPDRRAGRHSAWGLACGIRNDHLGCHRKVGEGDQVRRHQG